MTPPPDGAPWAPSSRTTLPSPAPRSRVTTVVAGIVGLVLVGTVAVLARPDSSEQDVVSVAASASPSATPEDLTAPPPEEPAPAEEPPPAAPPPSSLLMPADGGDGDSWKDTGGTEYRLGLVNAPERGECFAAEATAARKALVAQGFRAEVYTTDRYGRGVSVVTSADGVNVNVQLARHGFVDDRYLTRFRHENPGLAQELDGAFAAARAEGAGLWGACRSSAAAPPPPAAPAPAPPAPVPPPAAAPPPAPPALPAGDCHPDYVTCIPIQGTGSGAGKANDLDCGDIRKKVQVRQPGVDPYRLDGNGSGWGCESYG
jgi:endonuclease YncB( thermonuclease family)